MVEVGKTGRIYRRKEDFREVKKDPRDQRGRGIYKSKLYGGE